ncbi:MAG: TonB-dependent receptor [Ignavibacteriae bacterium]|nr:TonB-dependent receptor [Ignavibacteriota bacterium]
MKNKIIHYTLFYVLIYGFFSVLQAQVEEDSLVTDLNTLLNVEVVEQQFVSAASKYDQSPEEAPSSISIVTAAEIEAYGYQNLTEVLNSQNGFYYSNDRASDYIGVRGFRRSSDYNKKILLLLDGHRMNTYLVDHAPIGDFDITNFERIEIIRGPGSTLYGNNAVHAVINLIPKKNLDSYIPLLLLKYGSYNNRTFGLRTTKQVNENLSFSVYGTYQESDGEDLYFKEFDSPLTNNGLAVDQDKRLYKGFLASVNYKQFKLMGKFSEVSKHLPTAPFNSKFNERNIQYSNMGFLDFSWSPTLSYNKFLILKFSFDYQKYGSSFPFLFISDDIEFEGKAATFGSEVQFVWDILQNNRLIAGVEYKDNFESKYKYFTGDIKFVDDIWSYRIFSLFFQNEYQINPDLLVYFGLRNDNFLGQEIEIHPRLGFVYSPFEKHTFKFLAGRSFRSPNLIERNLEEKNIVRFKGNSEIKSERIYTREFIWEYRISENISSTLSLYNYNMEGLIDQVTDPLDNLLQYVNVGRVETNGVEVGLNHKFNKNGSGYFRYSLQKAIDEKSVSLSNSPMHLIKFGISNKFFASINVAFDIVYESERKTLYDNFTEPIVLSNINLYTEPIFNHFQLALKVRNLFNSTIRHPGGYELIQETLIQPYRNYIFTVTFNL